MWAARRGHCALTMNWGRWVFRARGRLQSELRGGEEAEFERSGFVLEDCRFVCLRQWRGFKPYMSEGSEGAG